MMQERYCSVCIYLEMTKCVTPTATWETLTIITVCAFATRCRTANGLFLQLCAALQCVDQILIFSLIAQIHSLFVRFTIDRIFLTSD